MKSNDILDEIALQLNEGRTFSKDEIAFNEASEAYIKKFGGSIPMGIGMPEITTELLLKAVAENKAIKELPIPKGAMS